MWNKTAISAIFIWIGFVGAISFMETWLKFRAPGVTLLICLGIGILVFSALNKVEWILLLISGIGLLPFKNTVPMAKVIWVALVALVIAQTFWLLQMLDTHAKLRISGADVGKNSVHLYYILAEIVKITALFITGLLLFQDPKQPQKL